jgi:hypothetical protein
MSVIKGIHGNLQLYKILISPLSACSDSSWNYVTYLDSVTWLRILLVHTTYEDGTDRVFRNVGT